MLRPRQVRQLVILGFLFLAAVLLMSTWPQLIRIRNTIFRTASNPPPPTIDEVPPPPAPPPGSRPLVGDLKDVKDLTPLDDLDSEPAYHLVIERLAATPEAALLSACEGEVSYATYLRHAPELRGRVFRLAGEAMQEVVPVKLYHPIEGRDDVYRAYLWDPGLEFGFVCDLIDRPAEDLQKREPIEIVGIFYKVVQYKNVRGRVREVPILLARSFRHLPPAPETPEDPRVYWLKVAIVIGVLGALVVAWFVLRGMARDSSGGRYRRERMAARRRTPPPAPPKDATKDAPANAGQDAPPEPPAGN